MFIINNDNLHDGTVAEKIKSITKDIKLTKSSTIQKNHYVWDIAAALDLECCSAYMLEDGSVVSTKDYKKLFSDKTQRHKDKKVAWAYIWTFKVFNDIFCGRDLRDMEPFLNMLAEALGCYELRGDEGATRLVVYVHNLSYDFQFFRKYIKVSNVFAKDVREAIHVTTKLIEYKCSSTLSARSLEKTAENLLKHDLKKLKGDLEYELLRHSQTPLTEKELEYCAEDVNIVQAYIEECIEEFGGVGRIPLTNTGRVRRYVRAACLYPKSKRTGKSYFNKRYQDDMQRATLTVDEYLRLKEAKGGGYTHANAMYVGDTINNVKGFDESSAYLAIMVCRQFPIGKGWVAHPKSSDELRELLQKYRCLLTIRLENIKVKKGVYDAYISYSKIREYKTKEFKGVINNGRIWEAEQCTLTVIDLDLNIIERCYDIGSKTCFKVYCYRKGFLPNELRRTIIEMYADKTTLKDVAGMEAEYQRKKGMVNSCYGMVAQDPITMDVNYIRDEWIPKEKASSEILESKIKAYNEDSTRNMCFTWADWVAGWGRWIVWDAIFELGIDFLYSDTDSVKFPLIEGDSEDARRCQKHLKYFEDYNEGVKNMMLSCMKVLGLPEDAWCPKDIKGVEHPLGYWADDGFYEKFKTLGAKRYMTSGLNNKNETELKITIAGVNKKAGRDYILDQAEKLKKDPFEIFEDDMMFPDGKNGKLTCFYIDDPMEFDIVDYLGNKGHVESLSGVHMDTTSYKMGLSGDFRIFLKGIKSDNIL